jgi:flagellar protein FliJ
MKSLHTLLKIARRDLDLLRRALAERNAYALAIEESMRAQEQTIVDEQQAALRDFEATRAYGGFAARAVAGRQKLTAEAQIVEQESESLRALITDAHVETRKFERLVELEEARARTAAAKREDAELDELTTQRGGRFTQR